MLESLAEVTGAGTGTGCGCGFIGAKPFAASLAFEGSKFLLRLFSDPPDLVLFLIPLSELISRLLPDP